MLENIRNSIPRLPMDRLGRNMGGRIPSCSRPVHHDVVAMATVSSYERLEVVTQECAFWGFG